jgi:inosine/xanthosine triphosphatase
MRIAVASTNPVKIDAVRVTVGRVWPLAQVEAVAVASGVGAMPMDDDECIRGALARATRAWEAIDADLSVGLEGGVHPTEYCLFLIGWVAVVDRNGRKSLACATRIPLPERLARMVRAGRELGPLMDEITGRHATKQAEGAVGILTQRLVTRQESFEAAVAYALAPWLNPELYDDP